MLKGSTLQGCIESVPSAYPLTLKTIMVAVLALLLALVALYVISRKALTTRGNIYLLVGLPDGGKTTIFSALTFNQALPSHMSLQANSSNVTASSGKTVRVVDIPGHPRIRDQFREHLQDLRGIMFVVDSNSVSRNGAAVAEHLHLILDAVTSIPPSQTPPHVLIVAHKADMLKAATSSTASETAVTRVRGALERELEKRRVTQAQGVGMDGLGEEGDRVEMGGLETVSGKGPFKFTEWEGGDITFVGSFVRAGEKDDEKQQNGISALQDWIAESS
ncbi:hypothetical protein CONPUDRAFT_117571 [Coniophora puteana RWD-64-598 SS2]|uniref:Signal recognition particle receptor subunit beta n=1 Tax=Coniophora puteana (strain RWD-64-598) TaxID=741705 RepID=A0A5M3N112_CONPW|nr:uncharacterized protein CONPUDRAFT_117571 [Coniophora puteana RWD-64-598 SS2]EIW85089.1 hypothetical protein CONPUDRAFT_117571 [Coniophora puteana RWD-64-598 SS2]